MKRRYFLVLIIVLVTSATFAQDVKFNDTRQQDIVALIDAYTQTRENKDMVLLGSILTDDIDQLVSSGEWRNGKKESVDGMMRSSGSNPGSRTITVEKIRFFDPKTAIVDAKYEIQNNEGTTRKMWSTFIVVYQENSWKIAAIRNMLPAGQQ